MTTEALCVDCDQRPAEVGSLLCLPDRLRLATALAELADGYARLDPRPVTGGSRGGRGAPGFGSRPPVRVDVLTLTDRRTQAFDPERPAHLTGIVRVVGWWADQARDASILEPRGGPRTVDREVELLVAHLDEIAERYWVGWMATAIHGAAKNLRRVLGELQPTIPIGACPELMAGVRCNGQVRARAYGEKARCVACDTRWNGLQELRELGRRFGDVLMDAPGISRYLDVPIATVRVWAHRDGWRRTRVGRRTLYALAAARESKDARTAPQVDNLIS